MRIVGIALLLCAALAPKTVYAGASGWSYFAPYETDTMAAMQKLRWDVFRAGKYFKLNAKRKARSPDHALRLNDTEGTHTIIDVQRVASSPPEVCPVGSVCPLSRTKLVELFGSERPARSQVEAAEREWRLTFSPWSGVYIVVYQYGAPKWLYFAGATGD